MSGFVNCLWFDTQAQEAAEFYTGLFPDSKIHGITPYVGGDRDGQAMTVDFTANGQNFVGLNGGPEFRFNESISFQIMCADQAEVDRYWDGLTADGGEESMCGWLKDRFGVSWQVVPTRLGELFGGSEPAAAGRVGQALFGMKKIIIADLEAAAAGQD